MAQGADPNSQNAEGDSLLIQLIKLRKEECVRILLFSDVNVNQLGKNFSTPLWHAVANSQEEIVQMLLAKGARVSVKVPGDLTDGKREFICPLEEAVGQLHQWSSQLNKTSQIDELWFYDFGEDEYYEEEYGSAIASLNIVINLHRQGAEFEYKYTKELLVILQNFPLRNRCEAQLAELSSHAFLRRLSMTKLIGHFWELTGQVTSPNGEQMELGYFGDEWAIHNARAIHLSFTKECQGIFPEELEKFITQCLNDDINSESYACCIRKDILYSVIGNIPLGIDSGQPVFIATGWKGHTFYIVSYGQWFVLCDTSSKKIQPCHAFQVLTDKKIDCDLVDEIIDLKNGSMASFESLLVRVKKDYNLQETASTLQLKLYAKEILDSHFIPICVMSNLKVAVFVLTQLYYASKQNQDGDALAPAFSSAKPKFLNWEAYQRLYVLEKFLELYENENSDFRNILLYKVKESFDFFYSQDEECKDNRRIDQLDMRIRDRLVTAMNKVESIVKTVNIDSVRHEVTTNFAVAQRCKPSNYKQQ